MQTKKPRLFLLITLGILVTLVILGTFYMLSKIKNQVGDLALFWKGLRNGEYPNFVVRNEAPVTIPVFSYHRIIADEFEEQLKYLKENGYQTFSTDEYFQHFQENHATTPKCVVLTFDDGIEDLYSVAYPLLKKYQMKAVAFIIANWMGRPNMVTWEQINEMHQAGVVDFQSHSLNHAGIFSSSKMVDFFHPGMQTFQNWNVPLSGKNGEEAAFELPEPGTPIYEHASRLSDHKRFYPSLKLRQACINFVREKGGENFFQIEGWKKLLEHHYYKTKSALKETEVFEDDSQQEKRIFRELSESKAKIETMIPGKTVNHFSFPWNESGVLTTALLKKVGYLSAYGGLSREYHRNGSLVNIFYINRVSGDFVLALPGKGRQSMAAILFSKIKRRLTKGVLY